MGAATWAASSPGHFQFLVWVDPEKVYLKSPEADQKFQWGVGCVANVSSLVANSKIADFDGVNLRPISVKFRAEMVYL